MIDIRIQNQSLDLYANTSITFNLVNPLFEKEVDYSSHSFSFTLPNSPLNRRVLKSPEVILRTDNNISQRASIWIGGVQWLSGLLVIQSSNSTQYRVFFQVDNSAFAQAWKDKMLNTYELGGIRSIGNTAAMKAHALATTTGDESTFDYLFAPIANLNFYGGAEISSYHDRVNFYDHTVPEFRDNTPYAAGTTPYEYNLTPFIYLTALLRYIFEELGYTLIGGSDWLTEPEIKTLVLYNNFALDHHSTFTTGGGDEKSWNDWLEEINLQLHVPEMTTGAFLQSVLDLFCLAMLVDEKTQTVKIVSKKSVIQAQTAEDWRGKSLHEALVTDEKIGGYHFFYTLDSKDTVTESIRNVDAFRINADVMHDSSLPATGDDIGDLRYVRTETAYYQYYLVEDSNPAQYAWRFFAYYMPEKTVGDGSIKINPAISTVNMSRRRLGSPFLANWQRTPYVSQEGSTEILGIGKRDFGAKLMFYRGLRETTGSTDTYPLVACDNLDAKGLSVWGYTLFWDGHEGLYSIWWENWAVMMMNARIFEQPLRMDIADLLMLDYTRKKRVATETGAATCLIRTMQVTINMERIEPVTATLVNLL